MQRIAVLGPLLLTTSALAQVAITINVENPVLMPGESTTVTLLAGFDRRDYAMSGVETDLVASIGSVGFSNRTLLEPLDGPGTSTGTPSATGFDRIIGGQLHFPSGAGIFADPINPAPLWQITYTAPVDVATPFDVDLSTMSNKYDVYIRMDSGTSETRLAELVEGSGTIRVIPAPASALVLAGGVLALRRRR